MPNLKNSFLKNKLEYYGTKIKKDALGNNIPSPAIDVAEAVFGSRPEKILKDKTIANKQNNFYDLSKNIRHNLPIEMARSKLIKFVEYINDEKNLAFWTQNELSEKIDLNDKQREFEGTYWWFYYNSNKTFRLEDGTTETRQGIVRALLTLGDFGKVELYRSKAGTGIETTYEGYFSMMDENKLMLLELNWRNGNRRFLRILVHIASGNMEFALAGAINTENKTRLTTAVIVPIKEKFKKSMKDSTKFYSLGSDDATIPDYVWAYLAISDKNTITIPTMINTQTQFWAWKEKHK